MSDQQPEHHYNWPGALVAIVTCLAAVAICGLCAWTLGPR